MASLDEKKQDSVSPQFSLSEQEKNVSSFQDDSQSISKDSTVKMTRNFSTWQIVTIGFGLTNSWLGVSSTLVLSISSLGPMLVVYGILIVACVSVCIAVTLGEMASAMPSAGGQYVWARVLAPRRYSSFWAYVTGSISWGGAIFTTVSMNIALSFQLLGFWNLTHPEHVNKPWEVFVIYNIINVIFGISITSYCIIMITVLACSSGNYQSAKFVFVDTVNNTGWSSSGIAFVIGLVNPAWAFSCLDSVTHLSEETAQPEKDIPKAVLTTVAIGFATSFTFVIAMFFCITDLDQVMNSATGLPILDIFYQALKNKAGALCLGALVYITASGCTIASCTFQNRVCFSFARDNGLPFSKYLSIIDPKSGGPLYAHIFCTAFVSILSVLVFSDAALAAASLACISFLLLAYAVPTICLLARRRKIRHGPFWLGKFGAVCNVVLLAWCIFALVFFSFPATYPATVDNTNYFCVLLVAYIVVMLAYWWFPIKSIGGKYTFRGGNPQGEEVEFPDICIEEWK
ncbi:HNM1 Choline transport protein [Candida maltosa Xu316]